MEESVVSDIECQFLRNVERGRRCPLGRSRDSRVVVHGRLGVMVAVVLASEQRGQENTTELKGGEGQGAISVNQSRVGIY